MSASTNRSMSPGEVAELFGVGPNTVTRWALQGWITSFTTLGGHRRFHWSDIKPFLAKE